MNFSSYLFLCFFIVSVSVIADPTNDPSCSVLLPVPTTQDFCVTVEQVDSPNCEHGVCMVFPGGGGGGLPCLRWAYSNDSTDDGTGGEIYEIHGIAFRQTLTDTYLIINSGHPLTGHHQDSINSIDMGDILIDFGNRTKFADVDGTPLLWGIHLTPDSDSPTQEPGVYSSVTSGSVVTSNNGHSTWGAYSNAVGSKNSLGDAEFGDINLDYYDSNAQTPNVIASGTRECGFAYLDFGETPVDCSISGNENSAYCLNNPNALFYTDANGVKDTLNICQSDLHQDITCESAPTDYAPPSGWTKPYNIGVRISNSCFGSHWSSGNIFRSCFAIECGNDVVCIDGQFTCQ